MALVPATCLAMAGAVHAAPTTWTAGVSSNWDSGTNWSAGYSPGGWAQGGTPNDGYFGTVPGDVCGTDRGLENFRGNSDPFDFFLLSGVWNPRDWMMLQNVDVFQTGGTWRSTDTLYICFNSGYATSRYYLADGNVELGNLYMGLDGFEPEFHQDGGTVTATGNVTVNYNTSPGRTALYEMTAGTLDIAGALTLGNAGNSTKKGHFTISGGDVSLGSLTINDGGRLGFLAHSTGVITIDGDVVAAMEAYKAAGKITGNLDVELIDGNTVLSPPPYDLGDVNGDGNVDNLDITPFIYALVNGESAFDAEYPTGEYWAADCYDDENIDNLDITPFVAAVVGGGEAVPEPTTVFLLCGAVPMLLGLKRRRNAARGRKT